MDLGLAGRRAIVFGSTAGLGRAIAETLDAEGALVAVSGRRAELAAEVAAALPGAVAVAGDLTVDGEPARMVDEAASLLGGLDICVVNTSGGPPGGMTEVSAADEVAAYERMLRPALAVTRAAIPHLRAGGDGRLVYITARSVVEASPELALSGVFRSGVAAAARSLAIELAPEVLVNVVVPGQFDTAALARAQQARAGAEGHHRRGGADPPPGVHPYGPVRAGVGAGRCGRLPVQRPGQLRHRLGGESGRGRRHRLLTWSVGTRVGIGCVQCSALTIWSYS